MGFFALLSVWVGQFLMGRLFIEEIIFPNNLKHEIASYQKSCSESKDLAGILIRETLQNNLLEKAGLSNFVSEFPEWTLKGIRDDFKAVKFNPRQAFAFDEIFIFQKLDTESLFDDEKNPEER